MNYIQQGFWGGVKVGAYFMLVLAIIDASVVVFTMLQIASGVDTPHIAFWDAQIRFVADLLK